MENKNYQVYCDLDGVLVDFEKGIVELGNDLINTAKNRDLDFTRELNPTDFKNNYEYKLHKLIKRVYRQAAGWKGEYTFSDFESRTKGSRAFRDLLYFVISKDKDWWINLSWINNGKVLWNNIEKYNPIILSSPVGPISAEGKRIWCKSNLGLSGDRVIIVDDKGIKSEKIPILIDDRTKAIKQIEAVGGLGILHVDYNYKNTLEILNDIINII